MPSREPTSHPDSAAAGERSTIPVVLFAYARPEHLRRTLECLQQDHVPLLYTFSDGPRTPEKAAAVAEVRQILRAIDWCQVVACDRDENLGLGRSIRRGMDDVMARHEAAIVFEDDLICVPGTYRYLCAALQEYWDEPAVMSVTGWTHPRATPDSVGGRPYFDGRAECLAWGTWANVWRGMEQDAQTLLRACRKSGIDEYRYGADLPAMAGLESKMNIWAVRFSYLHILNSGLCLRPPHSLVEHIGFDELATNASDGSMWANPPLRPAPTVPNEWPSPVEHPDCAELWQRACGGRPSAMASFLDRVEHLARRIYTRSVGSRLTNPQT